MHLRDKKSAIRTHVLQILKSMTAEARSTASEKVHNQVTIRSSFHAAKHIGIFISMPHEVDTRPLVRTSLAQGKRVFVPRTQGKIMTMLELQSDAEIDDFPKTRWGIPEPPVGDRQVLEHLEHQLDESEVLMIVPGVAFNRDGARIGYGGGYYDRYLNAMNDARRIAGLEPVKTIAIGLDAQIVDEEIPLDDHDVKIDEIITA